MRVIIVVDEMKSEPTTERADAAVVVVVRSFVQMTMTDQVHVDDCNVTSIY